MHLFIDCLGQASGTSSQEVHKASVSLSFRFHRSLTTLGPEWFVVVPARSDCDRSPADWEKPRDFFLLW